METTRSSLLPPRADSDGTLRRLQEEALVRFAERGYHGVSVREIAEAAGVRASSMYAHLASKQELLTQLIRLGHEEHRDRLRQALMESGADPADQLASLVRAHVRMHTDHPMLGSVSNSELHALDDEHAAIVLAIRTESERIILDVIERGCRLGAFTCPDPWLALAAIGAMGMRVAAWFEQNTTYSAADVADAYAAFALKIVT